MSSLSLEQAYARCEQITRAEARNFSYGIRLLPPVKRRALSAVYALARRIDDIGDGDLDRGAKRRLLEQTRHDLDHLDTATSDPVLVALCDAAQRLPIPLPAFGELIDGCEADVEGRHYQTFEETVFYCRCVAGSIGRISLGVYNPPRRVQAQPLANTLGLALQLTNILRDLREDRLVGRVYLPQEDLDRFGCTLDVGPDAVLQDPPERFTALVRFEADRAERWYAEGLQLLPLLDRRSAACTAAMAGIYRRLLAQIAEDPEPIRSARLSLSPRAKAAVAAKALLRRAA
ncbi:MAG TPA: squalene/phytoene synthase family protein [Segeticoccus sp.]|uniref:squalene/phytoene synthase family protein n=1 Tax=Segeticoccus sp. TaxID=2706531 RepID=UPI002D7FE576|nr:squalene/phytoene synthase family protein [Segeticoccus sp.]HET8600773.1 squalene/phytoene synthase family protein [Segeticoccus sp.]